MTYVRTHPADIAKWNVPGWTWPRVLRTFVSIENFSGEDGRYFLTPSCHFFIFLHNSIWVCDRFPHLHYLNLTLDLSLASPFQDHVQSTMALRDWYLPPGTPPPHRVSVVSLLSSLINADKRLHTPFHPLMSVSPRHHQCAFRVRPVQTSRYRRYRRWIRIFCAELGHPLYTRLQWPWRQGRSRILPFQYKR